MTPTIACWEIAFCPKGFPRSDRSPGCHKSRLILTLAACCVTGHDFLELPTFAENKRWLILQFENDNRRLKYDFGGIKAMLGANGFERFDEPYRFTLSKGKRTSWAHWMT